MLLWIFKKSKNTCKKIWIMKTCSCKVCNCNAKASTLDEIEKIFGWRTPKGKNTIIQSRCRKCRMPHENGIIYNEINPILEIILDNKSKDQIEDFFSKIGKFDEEGKLILKSERYKLARVLLTNQYEKTYKEFAELLVKNESIIPEEKFIELFEMYNFEVEKLHDSTFYSFLISSKLVKEELQIEWKTKQKIVVILARLYGTIDEIFMKGIEAKLHDSLGIIITIIDENPLKFSYNTNKICVIDREILNYLLAYRMNKTHLQKPNMNGSMNFYDMLRNFQKI